jgi:hypothetical protein
MTGSPNAGHAIVAVTDSSVFKDEVNRANIAAATVAVAAVITTETANYTLSDLEFRIVRYLMLREFYDAKANTLANGGVHKL